MGEGRVDEKAEEEVDKKVGGWEGRDTEAVERIHARYPYMQERCPFADCGSHAGHR